MTTTTARPSLTITDALDDPHLFAGHPAMQDRASWHAWRVFLASVYGLPLAPADVELFKRHTGRSHYRPPAGGWKEVVSIVGRQSGKSRCAALLAAFEAALHVVEKVLGKEAAEKIADGLVYAPDNRKFATSPR